MNSIYYWRDIYGDLEHMDTIYRLFQGERAGLHFERLRHDGPLPIYSIRLNLADRLLFTTFQDSLCLLDVVFNRDYHKSRFLSAYVKEWLKSIKIRLCYC